MEVVVWIVCYSGWLMPQTSTRTLKWMIHSRCRLHMYEVLLVVVAKIER